MTKNLDDNLGLPEASLTVLRKRYLKKDKEGKTIETPKQMYHRVADWVAAGETLYLDGLREKTSVNTSPKYLYEISKEDARINARAGEYFNLMADGYFIPNSPTLMNSGPEGLGQLAACFVLPIPDSIEGIFEELKNTALVHKSGGGTGFSFSRLRPKDSLVRSTSGVASGPISFMKIFNTATEQVKQGGTRRGANMGILRVDHPDIMEFIYSKSNEGDFNNFNISVGLTDEFREALVNNSSYDLVDPRDKKKIGKMDANIVYDAIIEQAWKTGDPGVIFLDRINRGNPTPKLGELEATNPCGEQPLLPYEACNLGSINLSKFIDWEGELKRDSLEKVVRIATRFLDNVIDMGVYPIEKIEEMVKGNRKIGLGVMGFADYLIKKGVSYNSSEAIVEAESLMKIINDVSKDESRKLAKEKGTFPNFSESVYKDGEPIRNATTTTIAPTGTISVINNSSSGIEPLYARVQKRHVKESVGEDLYEPNQIFLEYLLREKLDLDKIVKEMKGGEKIEEINSIPEEYRKKIKQLFTIANEIPVEQHISVQGKFQKHTDNAVSKTINLPKGVPIEEVRKAYNLSYELGCKGITIYVDGSKGKQILTDVEKGGLEKKAERPEVIGTTVRQDTPHGNSFITTNVTAESFFHPDEDANPYEVFTPIGKGGKDMSAIGEGYGRLISLCIKDSKYGGKVALEKVIGQLEGIGGETQIGFGEQKIQSFPDAIAEGLKKGYSQLNNGKKIKTEKKEFTGNFCEECGGEVHLAGGCPTCSSCGFSKC